MQPDQARRHQPWYIVAALVAGAVALCVVLIGKRGGGNTTPDVSGPEPAPVSAVPDPLPVNPEPIVEPVPEPIAEPIATPDPDPEPAPDAP